MDEMGKWTGVIMVKGIVESPRLDMLHNDNKNVNLASTGRGTPDAIRYKNYHTCVMA